MAASDILVRVQELGGSWLPIGTEKNRGIWIDPTNFSLAADSWGTQQLQALVRYNPRVIQPHLSAFTPWECELGGILSGSGRINQTPANDGDDRSITIIGEGWQYHLDDDVYQLQYIHTNMTDWQDCKQGLQTHLDVADYAAGAGVSSDNQGSIVLDIPANLTVPNLMRVGVYIDLGPDTTCAYAAVDYTSNGVAQETLVIRGQDSPQFGSQDATFGFTDAASVVLSTAAGTLQGSFATPRRYISIFMIANTSYGPPLVDVWCKLLGIRLFSDASYQSSGQSILVGSAIALDAIDRATVLLSSDTSQVQATSFVIPEFAISADTTPRTAITNATAFDDVIPRITVDRQLSIRPRPQLPIYEVGEWAGAQFQDASTNSGDQIFNSVSVSGTDATGAPLKVRRNQAPTFLAPSNIQATNPSATTNTTGWSSLIGTFSRDTSVFDSTPASFKCTSSGGIVEMETSAWTGTFVAGETYQLTFRYQGTSSFALTYAITDANGSVLAQQVVPGPGSVWTTGTLTFIPQTSGAPRFTVTQSVFPGTATINVDTLALTQGAATLVDRRGFRKTYALGTNMSLTGASAAALGDVYLASHRTTPFKGTLTIAGPGSVRRVRGGQSVTPSELLRNTGELILFSYLTDPDTGGLGRYGRIASVSLSGPWNATIQIDSTNDNFQDLLNRIQVNTAQVR